MTYDATSARIAIRRPDAADCEEYLALMQVSAAFHHPWVDMPRTRQRFEDYLKTRQSPSEDGFVICDRESGAIAGVINLNCIVRHAFQSAYLGYCVGQPLARRGYMTEAMKLVARYAFGELKLHRLEANIQPTNTASIALVRRCGFRKEGFSPRYLKILDEWRDHERWALLSDDEQASLESAVR